MANKKFKVRKKPVIVDAERVEHNTIVKTLEGEMAALRGDYIITGVRGERYPINADIFAETYERADTQPPSDAKVAEATVMQIVKAIEYDLNGRRGFHLDTLPTDIKREVRKTWFAKLNPIVGAALTAARYTEGHR